MRVTCATRRRDERSGFAGRTPLPVPAAMPVPGRCSGPEKLGAVVAWKRTLTARASRQRSGAAVLPDAACAQARPRGIAQANWWSKPLYQGAACNLADRAVWQQRDRSFTWRSRSTPGAPGVVAVEMLRVLCGCVAGVKPDADPVKRITVNVGSAPCAPGRDGGRARRAVC